MFLQCFFSSLLLCRLTQFVLWDFDALILHPDLIYMVLLGPAEEKQPRLTVMVDGDLGIHSLVSTTWCLLSQHSKESLWFCVISVSVIAAMTRLISSEWSKVCWRCPLKDFLYNNQSTLENSRISACLKSFRHINTIILMLKSPR